MFSLVNAIHTSPQRASYLEHAIYPMGFPFALGSGALHPMSNILFGEVRKQGPPANDLSSQSVSVRLSNRTF